MTEVITYPTFRTKYYWLIKKMLQANEDTEKLAKASDRLAKFESKYPFYANRAQKDFIAMEVFDEDF